jgi:hypothetical protein
VRPIISVLAASLALAAGTGCGDEEPAGGGATTTTPAATEATTAPAETTESMETQPEAPHDQSAWAAEVDEACEPVQRQIDALPPPTDAASLETWVAQVLPLVREEVAAVKAVKPPGDAEEAGEAKLFVESLERLEGALTRYLGGLRANDTAAVEQALADANAAGAEARALALSLDVSECGGYSGS